MEKSDNKMILRIRENTFTAQFSGGNESVFLKGTTLLDILKHHRPPEKETVVLAKVNQRLCSLQQSIDEDCTIEWVPTPSLEGTRAYQQTLCLILIRAVLELYPHQKLLIDHSLGKGLFCRLQHKRAISLWTVKKIKKRMMEIIQSNESIQPVTLSREQAAERFRLNGEKDTLLLGNQEQFRFTFYQSGGVLDFFDHPLLSSTNRVQTFDLRPWPPGMILNFIETSSQNLPPFIKQKKLFRVFHEYGRWESILKIQKAADINEASESGEILDLVKIAEGLHEKKIAHIADTITKKKKIIRIVLISGPSSSGKTTFTKRLGIQLRVNGLKPLMISLDDYFLNREQTPRTANGDYNYESPEAIDILQLNRDLQSLLAGETVPLPHYDFKLGKRLPGATRHLESHQPILIEGIHGLNDQITPSISRNNKLKIYISALTQLNITDHTRVPTSDVRLLRRLIRDYQFRNYSPEHTIERWPLVRLGEEKNIFPFQEEADIMFNSSLIYELPVLREMVKPLLERVPPTHAAFFEAQRLILLLLFFLPLSPNEVPSNSILREFIGRSSFDY